MLCLIGVDLSKLLSVGSVISAPATQGSSKPVHFLSVFSRSGKSAATGLVVRPRICVEHPGEDQVLALQSRKLRNRWLNLIQQRHVEEGILWWPPLRVYHSSSHISKCHTLKSSLTYISFDHIVGVGGDVPGQAEITDLCHSALSQQDVSGCQVSVDTLQKQTLLYL